MLRKETVAFLSLALGMNQFALGQADTQAVKDLHWPKVDLNVLVVDKSGQPPAPLDKSAIHVFEDGVERPIESMTSDDLQVSLALLIDTSGSTYGDRKTIVGVVTAVIKFLPPGSEVMAVLFADKAFIDLPFTPAAPPPLAFLDRLDSRGPTAFYEALVATENYIAAKAKNSRRALVVLSDGSDNDSTLNLAQTIRRIEQQQSAPTLYFVGTPEPRAHFDEKIHSRRVIRLQTSQVGGFEIVPEKNEDAATLSTRITALIRSQYVLTFTAARAAPDERFRKLEVRVDRANLEGHAVSGYFPRTQ
jgi:Ca-activated chloride channel family protein